MSFFSDLLHHPQQQRQYVHALYTKVYSESPLTAQEHQLLNKLRSIPLLDDCEEMLQYIEHALYLQPELMSTAS
jgi:hypothetical protein